MQKNVCQHAFQIKHVCQRKIACQHTASFPDAPKDPLCPYHVVMDTDNMEIPHLTDQDTMTVSSDPTHEDGAGERKRKLTKSKDILTQQPALGEQSNSLTRLSKLLRLTDTHTYTIKVSNFRTRSYS